MPSSALGAGTKRRSRSPAFAANAHSALTDTVRSPGGSITPVCSLVEEFALTWIDCMKSQYNGGRPHACRHAPAEASRGVLRHKGPPTSAKLEKFCLQISPE